MPESPRDGVQSWTESMSARDPIRAVAETLREPRTVNWISEQADAAWSTTNKELQDLVDQGQLRRVEAGETSRTTRACSSRRSARSSRRPPARSCGTN